MKGEIQEFSEANISIGRNPGSSLCFPLEMTGLSRKHAEIRREGNQFRLVDLSTNGTFVNGRKVKEAILKDGDVLEFSEGGPKVSFLTKVSETQGEIGNDSRATEPAAEPEPRPVVRQEQPRVPVSEPPKPVEFRQAPPPMPGPKAVGEVGGGKDNRIELSSQKVSVPLIIQYGPTIRTFRELPIMVGKAPRSDFVLPLPFILDQHMQILFSHGNYWIKDLSGQNQIRINGNPIEFQASLKLNDTISLTPQGPVFCFLGEGRLAEVVEPAPEAPSTGGERGNSSAKKTGPSEEKSPVSFWSKLKDKF